jgi:hypothetical protein
MTINQAVDRLADKYGRYHVDKFTIQKSIQGIVQRGYDTDKAYEMTDSTLYKCYTLRRG